MSILINGMEMPLPGQIVLVEIDENGDVFAAYDGGRTKLTQHKAVPVPPHGRLIEESKVLDIVSEWCPDDDGSVGKVGDLREMLDEIEALPTIIPTTK